VSSLELDVPLLKAVATEPGADRLIEKLRRNPREEARTVQVAKQREFVIPV
jgi:hypothetical protein